MENVAQPRIAQKSFNPFPYLLIIILLLSFILIDNISVSALTVDDLFGNKNYIISKHSVVSNAPEWTNDDFPTSFIFYNLEDKTYYVATSVVCCGYRDNGYINSLDETFKLGDSTFRFYRWNGTEYENMQYMDSIDLSVYKLVSYNDSVSSLYVNDRLIVEFDKSVTGILDTSVTVITHMLKCLPILIALSVSVILIAISIFVKVRCFV